MSVLVVNHLSLDGVLQGPARADEDTRDGFLHGGWAQEGNDPAMGAAISERMGRGFRWLLGRRSYEDMLGHWNAAGGPFKDGLNGATKYVASSNSELTLPWPNSVLLHGDVPAQVAELREQHPGNLVIMGSGELIRSLLPHGLIDELLLMIHPVVLGSGARLFGREDRITPLQLADCTPTASGVLLAVYRRARTSAPATSTHDAAVR